VISDATEERKTVRALNIYSITGVIIISIAIILIIFLTLKRLMAPLDTIPAIANNIALGDLNQTVIIERMDEIGKVLQAMQGMIENLKEKGHFAELIASGDLTQSPTVVSERDSLGYSFLLLHESLNEIINKISAISKSLATNATRMSTSSSDMSNRASDQAASLEEIASSINEFRSRSQGIAENTNSANESSSVVTNSALQGKEFMNEMQAAMNDISDSSEQISSVIKTIDDIAFQTNLLALNAAVEAARAGQHGKGFAVVAEEVRSLASRSAKAAKETEELIEKTTRKVSNGTQKADTAAKAFTDIVDGITSVSEVLTNISDETNAQVKGIKMIKSNFDTIEQATQDGAYASHEVAETADHLAKQAEELEKLLTRFNVTADTQTDYKNKQKELPR